MIDEQLSALLALVTVVQCHLEGRAGDAGEDLAHMGAREGPRRGHVAVVLVLQGDRKTLRHFHVVEVDLALGQRPLADFFQGLTAGYTGQVQGNDHGDAVGAAVLVQEAVAVVGAQVAQGDLGYRAVGDPGRALAVDDDFIGADPGQHTALVAGLSGGPFALHIECAHVGTLVGMGNHPAADLAGAQLDQFLVTDRPGHLQGKVHDRQGDRQAGITPAHFLAYHGFQPVGDGRFELLEQIGGHAQLGGLLEDRPER